jgi:hypothetical protein
MPLSIRRAADADPQSGVRLSPEVGAVETIDKDDAVDDEVDVDELVMGVVVMMMETTGDAAVGGTGEDGAGSCRGVGCGGTSDGDGGPVPSHATMAT